MLHTLDDPLSLALLLVLLPLLAGAFQLLLGRGSGAGGWVVRGALLVVAVLALRLFAVAAPAPPLDVSLPLRTPSPAQLDGVAQSAPPQGGRLGAVERAEGWLALGTPRAAGATQPGLFAVLGLRVDPLGLALLMALIAAGLATALQLERGGGDEQEASGGPFGWLALACAALIGAVLSNSLLFALVFWQVGLCLALAVQHGRVLSGAPVRVGAGTLLLLGCGALATLVALLGAGDVTGGTWRYADLVRSDLPVGAVTGAALLGAIVIPCVVFPFRPGPQGGWAASQALYAGGLLPAGLAILLRCELRLIAPTLAQPLAVVAGVVAALAAVRALVQTRLDRALTWISLAQVATIVAALGLGSPVGAAVLAVGYAFAMPGLLLAADAVFGQVGSWDLVDLGGLKRARPGLFVGFAVCAAALIGVPPLASFQAVRVVVARALGAGGAAPVVAIGVCLAGLAGATCLLRITALAFRGSRGGRLPAGPAGSVSSVPILCLAFLAVAAVQPLTGARLVGPPAPWDLGLPIAGPHFVTATFLAVLLPALGGVAAGGICWSSLRAAPLAPPGTWRGRVAWLETRFEEFAPQRRVVQPLLRLASRWAAFDARVLEGDSSRAAAGLLRRCGALVRRPRSSSPSRAPRAERPALLDPSLRDSALVLIIVLTLVLIVLRA